MGSSRLHIIVTILPKFFFIYVGIGMHYVPNGVWYVDMAVGLATWNVSLKVSPGYNIYVDMVLGSEARSGFVVAIDTLSWSKILCLSLAMHCALCTVSVSVCSAVG